MYNDEKHFCLIAWLCKQRLMRNSPFSPHHFEVVQKGSGIRDKVTPVSLKCYLMWNINFDLKWNFSKIVKMFVKQSLQNAVKLHYRFSLRTFLKFVEVCCKSWLSHAQNSVVVKINSKTWWKKECSSLIAVCMTMQSMQDLPNYYR